MAYNKNFIINQKNNCHHQYVNVTYMEKSYKMGAFSGILISKDFCPTKPYPAPPSPTLRQDHILEF
jgi:hypothetical protein